MNRCISTERHHAAFLCGQESTECGGHLTNEPAPVHAGRVRNNSLNLKLTFYCTWQCVGFRRSRDSAWNMPTNNRRIRHEHAPSGALPNNLQSCSQKGGEPSKHEKKCVSHGEIHHQKGAGPFSQVFWNGSETFSCGTQ